MANTHLISRLQYRISCTEEAQAFELRHALSSTITQDIAEAIDEICNRYSNQDKWIRIPKLEIDLGALSMWGVHSNAVSIFSQQFEQKLQKVIAEGNNAVEHSSTLPTNTEALLFFLERGFLPRWIYTPEANLQALVNNMLTHSPDVVKSFLSTRFSQKYIWLRIVRQFDDESKARIISFIPLLQETLIALKELTSQELATPPSEQYILDLVLSNASDILSREQDAARLYSRFMAGSEDAKGLETHSGSATPDPTPVTDIGKSSQSPNSLHSIEPLVAAQMLSGQKDTEFIDEKLVIRTAGIVLLQPYLKPFFTELQLFDGYDWVSGRARERAAHLLHYLSTGEQQQPEWNLVLEKIICGIPLDVPIERAITISPHEAEECNALLTSVIENWPALKNTSIPALQEAFLCRMGLLQQTEKGWLIQVERKTHDVLLEAIPWSFSMLKFPWTNYMIEVVWL